MVNANRDGVSVHHIGRDRHVMSQHVRDASTGIVFCPPLVNQSAIVNRDGPVVIAVFPVLPKPGDLIAKTSAFAGIGILVIQKLENAT